MNLTASRLRDRLAVFGSALFVFMGLSGSLAVCIHLDVFDCSWPSVNMCNPSIVVFWCFLCVNPLMCSLAEIWFLNNENSRKLGEDPELTGTVRALYLPIF